MTIETKYNIGDEVWFGSPCRPKQGRVVYVSIYIYKDACGIPLIDVEYTLRGIDDDTLYVKGYNELYPTKEELLKSL